MYQEKNLKKEKEYMSSQETKEVPLKNTTDKENNERKETNYIK